MPVTWEMADAEVIEIARDLINNHHPDLEEASILFLFRSEPGSSNGRKVLGHAQVVSPMNKLLMDDADFIIWLSESDWADLSRAKRRALIDHELTHCTFDRDKPVIRPHDIEEFSEIVNRHGLWETGLMIFGESCARAAQIELPGLFEKKGFRVFTKTIHYGTQRAEPESDADDQAPQTEPQNTTDELTADERENNIDEILKRILDDKDTPTDETGGE